MTVSELIEKLQQLEWARKDTPVFMYLDNADQPDDVDANVRQILDVEELEDATTHEIEVWIRGAKE